MSTGTSSGKCWREPRRASRIPAPERRESTDCRNLLSRPPHRKRSERGPASGSEGVMPSKNGGACFSTTAGASFGSAGAFAPRTNSASTRYPADAGSSATFPPCLIFPFAFSSSRDSPSFLCRRHPRKRRALFPHRLVSRVVLLSLRVAQNEFAVLRLAARLVAFQAVLRRDLRPQFVEERAVRRPAMRHRLRITGCRAENPARRCKQQEREREVQNGMMRGYFHRTGEGSAGRFIARDGESYMNCRKRNDGVAMNGFPCAESGACFPDA